MTTQSGALDAVESQNESVGVEAAIPDGVGSMAVDGPNGTVYLTVEGQSTLVTVNAWNGQVGSIDPFSDWSDEPAAPSDVVYDPNTTDLYVAQPLAENVSVVDAITGTQSGQIVPSHCDVDALALGPGGNRLYVGCNGTTVETFSLTNDSLLESVSVSGGIAEMYYAGAVDRLFVSGGDGSNGVTELNATSGTVLARIPTGSDPSGMAFDPIDDLLFVANHGSNNVSVIDALDGAPYDTVSVGTAPIMALYDPLNGLVYVTDTGSDNVTAIAPSGDPLYSVAFVSSGLPLGTNWSVSVDGLYVNSTVPTARFLLPSGTFPFHVASIPGYWSNVSRGSVTVANGAVRVFVGFVKGTASVEWHGLTETELLVLLGGGAAVVVAALGLVYWRRRGRLGSRP